MPMVPGKRRLDTLVGDPCFGLGELRARAFEIGAAAVELGLRNRMPFDQRPIALEQQLRQLQRGFLVTAARQFLPVVQHHQSCAGSNVIAGGEPELDDLAAGF